MHNHNSINKKQNNFQIILEEDMTCAYVRFNMTQEDLNNYSKELLATEILLELKNNAINFGVKREFFLEKFNTQKDYLIAQGIKAIDGEDSKITMYKIESDKPIVKETENADFYDVLLIHQVKAGEWLGERMDATEGIPGKSVKGEIITPKKGINYPLYYDKKSVVEISSGDKTTLYAKIDGIVNYDDKYIFVSNYLEIDGDVGFGTGNIEFDGFVTVKGTICDGFSVIASKDIEIRGEMGIGNIKKIESKSGSIFIKGGISSKEKPKIYAYKDVYAKFLENAIVNCGGIVHICLHSINSIICAKEVLVEGTKGKIIGGEINAEMRITTPIIGSESEKRTVIEIKGFDRKKIIEKKALDDLKIEKLKLFRKSLQDAENYKIEISSGMNSSEVVKRLFDIKEELSELEKESNYLSNALRIKGSGEVQILKRIFPGVRIIIKGKVLDVISPDLAGSYFFEDEEIRKI